MPAETNPRPWGLIFAALTGGVVIGLVLAPQAPPPDPALRNLDASLWQQTSGEYRALCLQTYRFATERLAETLKTKTAKPPAVIMDLDETVFDNSPYQTWQLRTRSTFSDERWDEWERNHALDVKAVPGAVAFIAAATEGGARVFFISNRTEAARPGITVSLKNLKIPIDGIDERVLLMKDRNDSNKDPRRAKVRETHSVVMLVGDNLRDFEDKFKAEKVPGDDPDALRAAIARRMKLVDDADAEIDPTTKKPRPRWGVTYVVLPNATYGEWAKLAGRDPVQVLNDSTLGR